MTLGAREPSEILALVEARLADATVALSAGTGGAPLCRTESAVVAVKSAEGRATALMQVRRGLRTGTGDAATVLLEWRRLRDAQGDRHDRGWRAYWSGGITELELLVADSTHE